jgi:methylglutaconyl-CoA hydratase
VEPVNGRGTGPSQHLHERWENGVCLLILQRPQRRSALNAALLRSLRERLEALLADDGVCGLVLTGSGAAFCAGLDLREVRAHLQPGRFVRELGPLGSEPIRPIDDGGAAAVTALDEMLADLAAVYALLESAEKPVVAAVNGAAVAGGAGLVAACDVAVAAESAVIGFPGIRVGLVAPVLTGALVRRMGLGWAQYLLLSGELLDARRALACGLVHAVVADADCVERAVALAQQMAEAPRAAYVATKHALRTYVTFPHGAAQDEAARDVRGGTAGGGVLLQYDASTAEALDRFLNGDE